MFSDEYMKWRLSENIRPTELSSINQYISDLQNIENSWSGLVSAVNLNTFIMEAVQQLINAMVLFEQGYFDCAYYSLRSAVDISTTMVFLADMPYNERQDFFDAWKGSKDFPMQGQMIKLLTSRGNVFADMKGKMPQFFADAKTLSSELNKYVHKQGPQHFYVSRNHFNVTPQFQQSFVLTFESYLQRCIGVVAVMRLAIDAFPILLLDEEFLYRCFDSITDPYSPGFIEKYIGQGIIDAYKRTEIYLETYEFFMLNEKKNEVVFNIVKYQIIDCEQIDRIMEQLHLLSRDDIICVALAVSCNKVAKIYCRSIMQTYLTERKTKRKASSWHSIDFDRFAENPDKVNQPYDEAYISVLLFDKDPFFIEHNELLCNEEIEHMCIAVAEMLSRVRSSIPEM